MDITKDYLIRYYSQQSDDEQRMYKADRTRTYAQYLRLREIADFAARHLPFSPAARVLDLGCGDGYATEHALGRQPCSVCIGLDLSFSKLRVMRGRIERCHTIAADAECVPLKSASFDMVFCFELLEHVLDPLSLLVEIGRLLRRDGRCLISAPADSIMQPAVISTLSRLKYLNGRKKRFNEHLHFTSIARMRPMLAEARLTMVAHKLVGFQYPLRSVVATRARSGKLVSLERRISGILRFGSFGIGPLTFGNEYLLLCVRPR